MIRRPIWLCSLAVAAALGGLLGFVDPGRLPALAGSVDGGPGHKIASIAQQGCGSGDQTTVTLNDPAPGSCAENGQGNILWLEVETSYCAQNLQATCVNGNGVTIIDHEPLYLSPPPVVTHYGRSFCIPPDQTTGPIACTITSGTGWLGTRFVNWGNDMNRPCCEVHCGDRGDDRWDLNLELIGTETGCNVRSSLHVDAIWCPSTYRVFLQCVMPNGTAKRWTVYNQAFEPMTTSKSFDACFRQDNFPTSCALISWGGNLQSVSAKAGCLSCSSNHCLVRDCQ